MGLSDGTVDIELVGKSLALQPTLDVLRLLGKRHGNLGAVLQGIQAMDIDIYVDVVMAGAGMRARDIDTVRQDVYRTGMLNLMKPLLGYVMTLARGGRPPSDDDDGEGESAGNA